VGRLVLHQALIGFGVALVPALLTIPLLGEGKAAVWAIACGGAVVGLVLALRSRAVVSPEGVVLIRNPVRKYALTATEVTGVGRATLPGGLKCCVVQTDRRQGAIVALAVPAVERGDFEQAIRSSRSG
jgi:hypothetical protein